MATSTTLMFTVLPNGGPSSAYRLSLYVSPRLEGASASGLLQDWSLGNWPQKLLGLLSGPVPIKVELNNAGGPTIDCKIPPAYLAGLDPALWNAIFPGNDTRVTPRQFQDHSKRWIRSFQVRVVEAYIQNLYNTVANDYPDAFPDLKGTTPITELTDLFGRALPTIEKGLPDPRGYEWERPRQYPEVPQRGPATHPDRAIEQDLTTLATQLGQPNVPLAELFRGIRFYKRGNQTQYRSKEKPYDETLIQQRPQEPQFDFHQALAALGDFPFLLRKLGLIIDCELQGVAGFLPQFQRMQAIVPGLPGIAYLTPWTRYEVSPLTGFRPTPRQGGDLQNGLLRLDNKDAYDVIQTDPDGNLIKVFDYAVNMNKYRGTLLSQRAKNPGARSSIAPEETSLPALRSGGLMVVRNRRDDKVWGLLSLQAGFESNPEAADLFADDVLRGYRVDIEYRGKWHSLCRWGGVYDVAGQKITQPTPDEGYLKAESASSDDVPTSGPQKPDLYLHETVVAWRNWSLVTEFPGAAIVPEPQPQKRQKEGVYVPEKKAGAGFKITTTFKAEPKSLPPLRYGETYRLRARAVDLAGNSLAPPPSPGDPTPAGDPAPTGIGVSQPIEYLRYDPVPAPSLILTGKVTEGESVERMVIRSRGDAAPLPLPPVLGLDETTLFNQSNQRWVAAPKTTVGDAEAHRVFDTLFTNPAAAYAIAQRESGTFDDPAVSGTKILDINGATIAYPPSASYKKGDPLPDGMYWIHTEDPVLLPYLPDPLARGVAFMPKDGTNQVLGRPFQSTGWPDAQPFKLVLEPGAGPGLKIVTGGDAAELEVPRGEMFTINYSSFIVPPDAPAEGDLKLMARWRQMTATGKAKTKAFGYQNWMMTPWRTLNVVHAVEKPIAPPEILKMSQARSPGDTFTQLYNGFVKLHAPSTGLLEMRARWDDYIDDPLDATGWHVQPKDGHVLDRDVFYDESPLHIPRPGAAAGANGEPPPKHEFGDTKHRRVRYRLIGTTRYREYFPAKLWNYEDPITKQKLITTEGPEFFEVVNVLSSARPEPPEPLYIVPTFKWVNTPTGRQRLGGGLRIYLKRGWFSSGEGELLGLVMFPPGPLLIDYADELRKFVSQWGSDPAFDRDLTVGLDPSQLTSDPMYPETAPVLPVGENLLLAEENKRVRVQGYRPLWDDVRKLWYVDVQFAPTHYYTFVRFGLCRYQPDSLPDLEISRVVRSEFAQLLGDRTATLNQTSSLLEITVFGPSAISNLGQHLNQIGNPNVALGQTLAPDAVSPVVDPPIIIIPPNPQPNPAAGAGHRVTAQIEWRPKTMSGDLGWQPLESEAPLAANTVLASTTFVYWMGSVRWPRANLPTDRDYRLVLREYEIYETDQDVAEARTSTSAAGKWISKRLVYTDVFPLQLGGGPVITT